MSRAFYALSRPQQLAFRAAVSVVRDSKPGDTMEEAAFSLLDIKRHEIERTHTLDLHALVADRLALSPEADRNLVEPALFGGPGA